jgi:hypothetical protein
VRDSINFRQRSGLDQRSQLGVTTGELTGIDWQASQSHGDVPRIRFDNSISRIILVKQPLREATRVLMLAGHLLAGDSRSSGGVEMILPDAHWEEASPESRRETTRFILDFVAPAC